MTNAESTATTIDTLWMRKQRAYDSYAKGNVSLDEAAKRVAEIKPEQKPISFTRKVAILLVTLFASVVVPAWARRDGSS